MEGEMAYGEMIACLLKYNFRCFWFMIYYSSLEIFCFYIVYFLCLQEKTGIMFKILSFLSTELLENPQRII